MDFLFFKITDQTMACFDCLTLCLLMFFQEPFILKFSVLFYFDLSLEIYVIFDDLFEFMNY